MFTVRNAARDVLSAGGTALLAASLTLSGAGAAQASATGTTPIDSFTYWLQGATVKVPVGCFLTHTIKGSGRKITDEFAGADCVGPAVTFTKFCNWRIDFTYADTSNKTYRTSRGRTHTECKGDPLRKTAPQTLPKYGKACARLYVNGALRATQCHSIVK
ncbi:MULTISPECIES: hypothetical protein [unclassified Streptomyces]|uniref:hypothetical protein n=1 Tax=unclassified Streptomyces TaxID=2593676 RepID=UPI00278BCEC6|nr:MULTISPECIES: hypothetical protein [unclassified Streptomyces]